MKKVLFLILASFLVLSACGNKEESKSEDKKETKSSSKDEKKKNEDKKAKDDKKEKSKANNNTENETQQENTEQKTQVVNQQETTQEPVQSQQTQQYPKQQLTPEEQQRADELRANENSQYSDDWTEEDQAQAEFHTDGYGMADDTGDSVDEMMKRSEEFNKEMGLE